MSGYAYTSNEAHEANGAIGPHDYIYGAYRDNKDIFDEHGNTPRFNSMEDAKKMAQNVKQLNPNTKFTKNDFRA
jgi:hypothetical protein